jgi:glycosyl transferase family 25
MIHASSGNICPPLFVFANQEEPEYDSWIALGAILSWNHFTAAIMWRSSALARSRLAAALCNETAVMKAVYINLASAPERRRLMELQAERLSLEIERFAAVSVSDLQSEAPLGVERDALRRITEAELGCFLSHRTLWSRIVQTDAPCLILEDDVILSPKLPKLLSSAESLQGVEFLNLENWYTRRLLAKSPVALNQQLSMYRVFRDRNGSGAYILWPRGARRLLAGAAQISTAVDVYIHGLRGLQSFQVEPALAVQIQLMRRMGLSPPLGTPTTIQQMHNAATTTLTKIIAAIAFLSERIDRRLQRIVLWRRAEYRVVKMHKGDFELPDTLLQQLAAGFFNQAHSSQGPGRAP